jgi:hypothetical protein
MDSAFSCIHGLPLENFGCFILDYGVCVRASVSTRVFHLSILRLFLNSTMSGQIKFHLYIRVELHGVHTNSLFTSLKRAFVYYS